ncbi:MAG: hypothetical protein KBC95_00230 [Candidatus Peribacteraceae bacterium]|nr:hypothetical protein [Candidatus Peribacteraceae bacterium]
MSKHTPVLTAKMLRTIGAGALSVIAAFTVGLRTAGEVEPIGPIQANELEVMAGDLDGNGALDEADVTTALELSEGYAVATRAQLKADPNRDGAITAADAMAILQMIDSAR